MVPESSAAEAVNSPHSRIHGFPPLAAPGAHTLLLGSMPSVESLKHRQYYAHPRNAFWPIVTGLLGIPASDYDERARQLTAHGIAVWDVLQDCVRPGSLDSAIDEKTAVANDFPAFFAEQPNIARLFFNGAKAEALFLKRVLPGLGKPFASLPRRRLPSTSPANAGLTLEQKKLAWRAIIEG